MTRTTPGSGEWGNSPAREHRLHGLSFATPRYGNAAVRRGFLDVI